MIDRLVNVLFTACCVVLSSVAVFRHWSAAAVPVAREHVLVEGSRDPFPLPAGRLGRPRLGVLVSPQCRSCTESLPFYKRLADTASRAGTEVLFVGLEPEADLRVYLESGGVSRARIVSLARPPDLPGTPSIVALDTSARVMRTWAGRLAPRQEDEVLAIAATSSVSALLAEARARLNAGRAIDTVSSIEVSGVETLLRDTVARTNPYLVALRLPASLRLQTGPVVHLLVGSAYSRHLTDGDRFGGAAVERMLNDPASLDTAARGMQSHLVRLTALFFAGVPGTVQDDEGVRDFGIVRGRTVLFRRVEDRLQAELVLDPATSRPLAVVTPIRQVGGASAGTSSTWISMLGDYRPVAGIMVPHRIDQWIGAAQSRIDLARVTVDRTTPQQFADEMAR
ncbi:MAG TPA: hypothetical protein VGI12_21000 [Vicinamibacterales bacterium]|jgi:hypothetical protein